MLESRPYLEYVFKSWCIYWVTSLTVQWYIGFCIVSSHQFFFFRTDVFEKALNAGFIQATDYVEIWQAYLDYLRRRVDFSKGERSCVSKTVRGKNISSNFFFN